MTYLPSGSFGEKGHGGKECNLPLPLKCVRNYCESVVLPYLTMLMCDLFRGSCKSCAVEVESYAANGGLVGRYDGCRFLNVSQVHQGHSPCPLARVGQ